MRKMRKMLFELQEFFGAILRGATTPVTMPDTTSLYPVSLDTFTGSIRRNNMAHIKEMAKRDKLVLLAKDETFVKLDKESWSKLNVSLK